MIRKLLAGLAASMMVLTGLAATASPASAGPNPTTCAFSGTVSLSPGVNPLPPSQPGSFAFVSVAIVCVGGVTGVGTISANGTYAGNGSFSGTFNTTLGISGSFSGTRVGVVLVGSVASNAGNGPLAAVFVPSGTNGGVPPVITNAVVTGTVVLI